MNYIVYSACFFLLFFESRASISNNVNCSCIILFYRYFVWFLDSLSISTRGGANAMGDESSDAGGIGGGGGGGGGEYDSASLDHIVQS